MRRRPLCPSCKKLLIPRVNGLSVYNDKILSSQNWNKIDDEKWTEYVNSCHVRAAKQVYNASETIMVCTSKDCTYARKMRFDFVAMMEDVLVKKMERAKIRKTQYQEYKLEL